MNRPMPFNPNDPALKGGVSLQKVPVVPWDTMVGIGVQVYKDEKIKLAIFDPQPMFEAEEAFQTLRLLMAVQQQTIKSLLAKLGMARLARQPGPVAWDTVPESVRRHFCFKDDDGTVVAE